MNVYLKETPMLDFSNPRLVSLVKERGWESLGVEERIRQIYNFCKDEILFGYNSDTDTMPASAVLEEGFGHCNTKATLFMALLRAVGVPCRIHGFTIYKELQKGAVGTIAYAFAPEEIIHTWVEVLYHEEWLELEGLILDIDFLSSVQHRFRHVTGRFCGYAIATDDLQSPQTEWDGGSTYIQRKGIARDFGIFDSPDAFYARHGTNLKGIKKLLYKTVMHKRMNANVKKIRNQFSTKETGYADN